MNNNCNNKRLTCNDTIDGTTLDKNTFNALMFGASCHLCVGLLKREKIWFMPQNAQALNTVTKYTGSSKDKLEASSKKNFRY